MSRGGGIRLRPLPRRSCHPWDFGTEATLTGTTYDGTPIQGTDTVNIVPKGK